jgi:hypothetical protein
VISSKILIYFVLRNRSVSEVQPRVLGSGVLGIKTWLQPSIKSYF